MKKAEKSRKIARSSGHIFVDGETVQITAIALYERDNYDSTTNQVLCAVLTSDDDYIVLSAFADKIVRVYSNDGTFTLNSERVKVSDDALRKAISLRGKSADEADYAAETVESINNALAGKRIEIKQVSIPDGKRHGRRVWNEETKRYKGFEDFENADVSHWTFTLINE